jgi:hypothetical protein
MAKVDCHNLCPGDEVILKIQISVEPTIPPAMTSFILTDNDP